MIFDLDGTLVDSFPGIEYCAHHAIRTVLPNHPLPPLRPLIGPPIRRILQQALAVEAPQVLDALEAEFRRAYDDGGWRRTVPFPGALETLQCLETRGCRLMVLTNKPAVPTVAILRYLRMESFFADICTPDSAEVGFSRKPDGARVLKERHQLDPERTLLVGDSSDDREAALACGFRFAAVRHGYGGVWRTVEAEPDAQVLDALAELPKRLG